MTDLNGKNIIVTGASGGIGNSIIEKLNQAGAHILASGTRIKKLEEDKVIISKTVILDNKKINLPITVFLSISIQNHSEKWLSNFNRVVKKYDEIIEVHRLTGTNSDYQITILSPSIDEYDKFQQNLIKEIECTYMSSHISLQVIKQNHKLPLNYVN